MARSEQTPTADNPAAKQAPPEAPGRVQGDDSAGAASRAPARRPRASKAPAPGSTTQAAAVDEEGGDMRRSMIAVSAYYRAERRGFADGLADDDWYAAEQEIECLLNGPAPGAPS
jgi:hypothetical protein